MKRPKRRLQFNRLTIRELTASTLEGVGGGGMLPSVSCTQNPNLPTGAGRLTFKAEPNLPTKP